MRGGRFASWCLCVALSPALLFACTRTRSPYDPYDGGRGSDSGLCAEGAIGCAGAALTSCRGGVYVPTGGMCGATEVCVPGLGCRACSPGATFCVGNSIHMCNADGTGSTEVMPCGGMNACRGGLCVNACDAARADLSTIGCEYWAVDLDNEYSSFNNAAAEQFAVVIANPSDVEVTVIVERNDAPVGSPSPAVALVGTHTVAPQGLVRIDLPQREVDCSSSAVPAGVGTCVSGNAYRITTNFPVVAYQFNPIIQSFSNDASLLIPASGLDTHYRIIGWPTANPIAIGPFMMDGIPDHSFVTIVAVQPSTTVQVTLGGPIVGNMGIPAAAAGETVTYTLQQYEVLNLESTGVPGDLTGTVVVSDRPVAVFSGGERGIAPLSTDGIIPPPGGFSDSVCCTEHLEEQVFPTTTWGTDFVVTRSPVRADTPSWREPDIYRVMADKPGTTITTTLPPPNDSFVLGANQWREFPAHDPFILRASEAVSIQQILVSQQFLPSWRPGMGGDPSMTLFPPYQQYRDNYVFLVPATFAGNWIVIAMPTGTRVEIDGRDVLGDEFTPLCTYEMVGVIDGTSYTQAICAISAGPHRLDADFPVGIMVYGYYNVGSYAFAGGSNVTRINLL